MHKQICACLDSNAIDLIYIKNIFQMLISQM